MKREKRRKRRTNKFNLICTIGLAIMIAVFAFAMYVQAADYFQYKQQYEEAVQQRNATVEKNRELVDEIQFRDTDEYIEKIAREQLNLVKPNEIVFIDENK